MVPCNVLPLLAEQDSSAQNTQLLPDLLTGALGLGHDVGGLLRHPSALLLLSQVLSHALHKKKALEHRRVPRLSEVGGKREEEGGQLRKLCI